MQTTLCYFMFGERKWLLRYWAASTLRFALARLFIGNLKQLGTPPFGLVVEVLQKKVKSVLFYLAFCYIFKRTVLLPRKSNEAESACHHCWGTELLPFIISVVWFWVRVTHGINNQAYSKQYFAPKHFYVGFSVAERYSTKNFNIFSLRLHRRVISALFTSDSRR